MHNYVYIQYFLGQLLILCFGYNLMGRILIGYLTGLFLMSATIPILIRFIPGYIYYLYFSILTVSLIYFLFKKKHLEIFYKIKNNLSLFFIFILMNIFFLIIFKSLHYKNFFFESHDIVYWSPSIELYYSDCLENIRNFTYYPSPLTAHPLFPTSVLSTASILIKNLNLVLLLEIRYLLICQILATICFFFYKTNLSQKKSYYFLSFIIFVLLLYSFDNFLTYSFVNSGIFAVLIFGIMLANFDHENMNYIKFNSYLSLILLITKPGIMFMFLIFPFYYFFKYKEVRKDLLFYIISLIVFFNMMTWILIAKPVANINLTIFNPLNFVDYYQTLLLGSWIQMGKIFNFLEVIDQTGYILNFSKSETNIQNIIEAYKLQMHKTNFNLFKLFSVFVLFFLIPLIIIIKNYHKKHVFIYFLLIAFLILIFLRSENIYGNKSPSQVVHVIYILPIFIIFILLKSFSNKRKLKFEILVSILIFLLFSNFNINYGSKVLFNRSNTPESVEYSDYLNEKKNFVTADGFLKNLDFKKEGDVKKYAIFALMDGKRIHVSEFDKYDNKFRPVVMNWSIDRYHDFVWIYKIVPKNID